MRARIPRGNRELTGQLRSDTGVAGMMEQTTRCTEEVDQGNYKLVQEYG